MIRETSLGMDLVLLYLSLVSTMLSFMCRLNRLLLLDCLLSFFLTVVLFVVVLLLAFDSHPQTWSLRPSSTGESMEDFYDTAAALESTRQRRELFITLLVVCDSSV